MILEYWYHGRVLFPKDFDLSLFVIRRSLMNSLSSFSKPYRAVILGASGGIGTAFVTALRLDPKCAEVIELSRAGGFDLLDETSILRSARKIAENGAVHLIIDATGFLHDVEYLPEKTIRSLHPNHIARAFAINATGPLLAIKHLHKLLPENEKAVFATLSARVGSIEDNRLGGWISYRASKAALNMGVKTAAIEIGRKWKYAALIALHPGTVQTQLSNPYAGSRNTFTPEEAAKKMLKTIDQIDHQSNGTFLDYDGLTIPW